MSLVADSHILSIYIYIYTLYTHIFTLHLYIYIYIIYIMYILYIYTHHTSPSPSPDVWGNLFYLELSMGDPSDSDNGPVADLVSTLTGTQLLATAPLEFLIFRYACLWGTSGGPVFISIVILCIIYIYYVLYIYYIYILIKHVSTAPGGPVFMSILDP